MIDEEDALASWTRAAMYGNLQRPGVINSPCEVGCSVTGQTATDNIAHNTRFISVHSLAIAYPRLKSMSSSVSTQKRLLPSLPPITNLLCNRVITSPAQLHIHKFQQDPICSQHRVQVSFGGLPLVGHVRGGALVQSSAGWKGYKPMPVIRA